MIRCAGSGKYQIQLWKPVQERAYYTTPTRQHELDHTDHSDHEYIYFFPLRDLTEYALQMICR